MLHTTHRFMELNEVLLILGVFIPSFFAIIWQLNRLNPGKKEPKRATNAADSSVSELFAVQTEQIKEIVDAKNKQIKSYQRQLRQDQEVIGPESTEKEVTFEEITALVNTQFPKYAKFLPLVKKQVMDATKGMSMEEILTYVKQFTGNQESQGSAIAPDASGNTWRPDYA